MNQQRIDEEAALNIAGEWLNEDFGERYNWCEVRSESFDPVTQKVTFEVKTSGDDDPPETHFLSIGFAKDDDGELWIDYESIINTSGFRVTTPKI
jgi:hypothetical protein